MDDRIAAELRRVVDPGRVHADADLSAHTTLRVGGPAAALVLVDTVDELAAVAACVTRTGVPWMAIGRGSNLLVADAGFPGVVVQLGRGFRGATVDGAHVVAGAAEPMPVLARTAGRHGLAGLAFGVAIPGSLGGAVRMNAGAHGREIRDVLEWAEVVRMDRGGAVERWDRTRLGFGYRHSELVADAVVTRARLRLTPADAERIDGDMAEMRRWRREHQPINEPSCGSVFRNPPGDSAGRLVDAAGLKGMRVGGAEISRRHANFITARPDATAVDVHTLIRLAQARVREHSGVQLEPEVVLAGFASPAATTSATGRGQDVG